MGPTRSFGCKLWPAEVQGIFALDISRAHVVSDLGSGDLPSWAAQKREFGLKMDRRQNSLALMLYAYLAAIEAGISSIGP
jgi:hypothetical protein